MRQATSDGFIDITKKHEGIVPWLYLDNRGLVTTAIGNLVEVMNADNTGSGRPTANLFEQPWKNGSGGLASHAEIQAAFDAVKARQDLKNLGGGNQAFANLTSIRLGPPGIGVNTLSSEIVSFVNHVLGDFEATIKNGVPNFDQLPADAQLALMEHAWAVGPELSGWPKLRAALAAQDFVTAQAEDKQGGVTASRAQMTHDLWQNAIDAKAAGADFDRLYYPGTVANPGPTPMPVVNPPGGGAGGGNASISSFVTPGRIALGIGIGAAIAGGWFYLVEGG